MAVFKVNLTDDGKVLLARANAGEQMSIVGIVLGSGVWTEEQQTNFNLSALVEQKMSLGIASSSRTGEVYNVQAVLSNASLAEGFAVRELGVIVEIEDAGVPTEYLYLAGYAGDQYTYIVDKDTAPVSYPVPVTIVVGRTENITVEIADQVFATKEDITTHDADPDAHEARINRLHVSTPAITSPDPGQLDVIETPAFLSTAFETHFSGVTHTHSQYQVDVAAGDWTTPVHDSGADAVNLVSYTMPVGVLAESTVYKARCRHRCGPDNLWSEWSPVITFTTMGDFVYVEQPSNTLPVAAATDVEETPTFTSSAFAVAGGSDSHVGSQWMIDVAAGDFSSPTHDTGEDAVNLVSFTLAAGILAVSTEYQFRVRHKGTAEGWSAWSTPTTFTTAAVFFTSDDAVVFDPATPADWPILQTMDTASGLVATADDAHAYSDAEVQGGGETDWGKLAVQVAVKDPEELTVDGASTTDTLVLTSDKSGLLADGDKVLVNDGAAGTDLIETVLASVTEARQVPAGCTHEWPLDGDANDSVGSQNGTVNGSCTYGAGKVGQALSTPGTTGNYLALPTAAFDFSGPISFGFWIKTTETGVVVGSTQNTNDAGFFVSASSGDCYVADGAGGSYAMQASPANAAFNDGAWHHYFFTWDGTTGANKAKVYLDGVMTWSGTAARVGTASHKSTMNFGRLSDGDTWTAVEVDDILVLNREADAVEIAELVGGKYTCTSISPALSAVPDVTFLPVPLHEAHGADGDTWDGPEDFTAIALASATYVDNAGTKTITLTSEQIEPDPSFRQVALGVSGLPDGAEIVAAQLNLSKIAS